MEEHLTDMIYYAPVSIHSVDSLHNSQNGEFDHTVCICS